MALKPLFVAFIVTLTTISHANDRCQQNESTNISPSYSQLFVNKESVKIAFENTYNSPQKLLSPLFKIEDQYMISSGHRSFKVPLQFIAAITHHVNSALKNGYADFLFYPDMGHVHILQPSSATDSTDLESLLQRQDLLFLYHTGELFKFKAGSLFSPELVEDPWMQTRYIHRNFIGTLDTSQDVELRFALDQPYNTVREITGYKQVLRLSLSAHRDGCLSFRHNNRDLFFDISLKK